MAKKKTKPQDEIDMSGVTENSEVFQDLLGNIKSLPEDTIIQIPHDAVINVPISGNFMYTLQAALGYLMQAEEPYTVVKTLQKIKTGYKGVPQNERTAFDAALDAVTTLINEITAIASREKKTVVYDKEEFFSGLDKEFSKDREAAAKPLTEDELAERMGLKRDSNGKLVLDKDYIRKKGMDKEVTLDDGITGHFGRNMEEILETENDARPKRDRKENRQKKWKDD